MLLDDYATTDPASPFLSLVPATAAKAETPVDALLRFNDALRALSKDTAVNTVVTIHVAVLNQLMAYMVDYRRLLETSYMTGLAMQREHTQAFEDAYHSICERSALLALIVDQAE